MTNSAGIQHLPQGPASPVVAEKEVGFIPRPTHQQGTAATNVIFKLVNKSRGDVYVPLFQQNVVRSYGKTDGKEDLSKPIYDTIRVLKGVYTIWESEQKEIRMSPKEISKARRSVKFEWMNKESIARVPVTDIYALEALRILSFNTEVPGANKGSRFAYFEINTERQAEIEAKKRQQRRKAVKMAEDQKDLVKIKKHCVYLRIRLDDDYGTPKSEKALRVDYEDYADLNPERFLQSVGSKEVDIAYLINKAISDAKIDTSTHKGSAYWATGTFICKIPSGSKAADYLLEYAMNPVNVDGKAFLEQLENISI